MTLTIVLVLAAGTYAMRLVGPVLRGRVRFSAGTERALAIAATTLLAGFVGISALTESGEFAGIARPAGVAVGGVLALCRVPFVVVVLVAAMFAAGLRFIGVP